MSASNVFTVNHPDSERANVLAFQAMKKAEAEDFSSAISLIEEAIRLDSIAALNRFHALRAELFDSIEQHSPQKAIEMYGHAIHLKKAGRCRDAVIAYREAYSLDPLFLWPLNNLAWMLSTPKDESACNGPDAVKYALEACEKSNWNCWAFLGTLAAAYAAAGNFERAAACQKASLEIVPEDHRLDSEIMLRHFQSGQRYIDEGQPVAAGSSGKDGETSSTQLLRPEQNSKQTLQQLFQDAYMETESDSDGDLFVVDKLKVLVTPSEEGGAITLAAILRPRQHSTVESCLQFVNRINASIRLVRAAYHENGVIVFDYTIPVAGGIAKRTVVFAVRFFLGAVVAGIEQCDSEGVIKATGSGDSTSETAMN